MTAVFLRVSNVFRTEGLTGIRKRIEQRIRRVAFKTARQLNRPTFLSAYGVRMAANWGDTTFRYCAMGAYGEFLSALIRNQSKPFCFLDIGANQGLYTVLAARNPACQRVYSFEPVPHTAELLSRNIALNGVTDRCHVVRKAISESIGTLLISIPDGHSGAASIAHQSDQGQKLEIETIDGGGFAHIVQDATAPFLIKLDVEGHEAVVIGQILQSAIADQVAAIFYECDERWIDVEKIQAKLTAAGFRHFKRLGTGQHYDILATRI